MNQLWVLALHMCQVGSVGVAGKTAVPGVLDKSESQCQCNQAAVTTSADLTNPLFQQIVS